MSHFLVTRGGQGERGLGGVRTEEGEEEKVDGRNDEGNHMENDYIIYFTREFYHTSLLGVPSSEVTPETTQGEK